MLPIIGITVAFETILENSPVPGADLYYTNREYARAVELAGAVPVMLPAVKDETVLRGLLDRLDALVVTGGVRPLPKDMLAEPVLPGLKEQNPARYASDYRLIAEALRRDMPLLGICRGHQMINEVTGGNLCLRLPEPHPHCQTSPPAAPAHAVEIEPDTLVHRIVGQRHLPVNSLHLQAVEKVGPGMIVAARAEDGVVEAIESKNHSFVLGLQFHPEKMTDESIYLNFFKALANQAKAYRSNALR
ncbi:gamma-glutamyl-gamma-aminobutyrate hydrolase family protein [Neomoorella mulderi]|uniref:Putative glutamine amidotransferasec n=1 Tax=Moorella mulderi DSM 14980 TaxID=1122241 RepID=A0A151AZU6_9FIRM|nr:gamma-glutamyl-gamma-aminobutyrate hydrolase family protein [Moorella mulderi]KYH33178.1 putative glutamine amidotransferasec [Moorella mulderi DSM 14980]